MKERQEKREREELEKKERKEKRDAEKRKKDEEKQKKLEERRKLEQEKEQQKEEKARREKEAKLKFLGFFGKVEKPTVKKVLECAHILWSIKNPPMFVLLCSRRKSLVKIFSLHFPSKTACPLLEPRVSRCRTRQSLIG